MSDKIQYFSQCQQDRILDLEIFRGFKNGFFVDVGAHDGISINNTLAFEKYHDWSGICIEPLPQVYEQLKNNRKVTCLNCAISADNQPKTFMKVTGYGEMLSGLVDNYHPNHLQRIHQEIAQHGGQTETIQVPCRTLQSIFEEHHVKHVHYLSIDVEGGEHDVIHSIDFDNVFIDVIDLENNYNEVTQPIIKYLESKGFFIYKNIDWDIILVNKNSQFIAKA